MVNDSYGPAFSQGGTPAASNVPFGAANYPEIYPADIVEWLNNGRLPRGISPDAMASAFNSYLREPNKLTLRFGESLLGSYESGAGQTQSDQAARRTAPCNKH